MLRTIPRKIQVHGALNDCLIVSYEPEPVKQADSTPLFASKDLKGDKEVVLEAVTQNGDDADFALVRQDVKTALSRKDPALVWRDGSAKFAVKPDARAAPLCQWNRDHRPAHYSACARKGGRRAGAT